MVALALTDTLTLAWMLTRASACAARHVAPVVPKSATSLPPSPMTCAEAGVSASVTFTASPMSGRYMVYAAASASLPTMLTVAIGGGQSSAS